MTPYIVNATVSTFSDKFWPRRVLLHDNLLNELVVAQRSDGSRFIGKLRVDQPAVVEANPQQVKHYTLWRVLKVCHAAQQDIMKLARSIQQYPGLDIGLWQPLARGASESENPLAPQKTHWPPKNM